MEIIFWNSIISMHLHAFVESVAEQRHKEQKGKVTVIAANATNERRKGQGWSTPEYKHATMQCLENEKNVDDLIEQHLSGDKIHVFHSFRGNLTLWPILKRAVKLKKTIYVLSEKPTTIGGRYWMKRILYTFYAFRFNRHINGLFAYGEIGVVFFKQCFFSSGKVHETAYALAESTKDDHSNNISDHTAYCFTFIGSDLKLKRLDLLLYALAKVQENTPWQLIVVSADDCTMHQEIAQKLDIAEHIEWHGAMPNPEVRKILANTSTLVLPSDYDGWGAVVNEALHEGARAIVSNECGAASAVTSHEVGHIFKAGSVESLVENLNKHLALGVMNNPERLIIKQWAKDNISAPHVARKFLNIIENDISN